MDITEVARASGLPASTLRFYEQKGLIHSYGRQGLRRLFEAEVMQRLALIALGRSADLSLDEIGAMLTPAGPAIDRALLAAKADTLDAKIKDLTAMRDGLRHAAACKAANHLECPKFLRLARITGKKQQAAGKAQRRAASKTSNTGGTLQAIRNADKKAISPAGSTKRDAGRMTKTTPKKRRAAPPSA